MTAAIWFIWSMKPPTRCDDTRGHPSGLPALPPRIARLARDRRGFPVPWFVATIDGEPDFRVVDTPKLAVAIRQHRCWVCGEQLGVHLAFPIGPTCVANRVTAEPPVHRECAEFSARACPFLTKPRMRRNAQGLPEEFVAPPIWLIVGLATLAVGAASLNRHAQSEDR